MERSNKAPSRLSSFVSRSVGLWWERVYSCLNLHGIRDSPEGDGDAANIQDIQRDARSALTLWNDHIKTYCDIVLQVSRDSESKKNRVGNTKCFISDMECFVQTSKRVRGRLQDHLAKASAVNTALRALRDSLLSQANNSMLSEEEEEWLQRVIRSFDNPISKSCHNNHFRPYFNLYPCLRTGRASWTLNFSRLSPIASAFVKRRGRQILC